VTKAAEAGNRVIGHPYYEARPGLQIGTYIATKQYIGSHGDVVDRFAAGVAKTAAYVTRHPEALRKLLVTEGHMPPALAKRVTLPVWKQRADTAALTALGGLMKRYGAVEKAPPVENVVAESAR
jgi:NitT/TauT family transport system substrate-binding protein